MQKNNFMNTVSQDIIDKSFKNFDALTRLFFIQLLTYLKF